MKRLLEILEAEGPVDPDELAVRLGRDRGQIEAELESLRAQGILLRYSALLNWEAAPDLEKVYAFINVSANPEHGRGFDKVAEYLCSGTPAIVSPWTGDYGKIVAEESLGLVMPDPTQP